MHILKELYQQCTNCNCEMPNDKVTDGVCAWCNEGEAPVASVEPPGVQHG